IRRDPIADQLLELLGLGEPAGLLAIEELLVVEEHPKEPRLRRGHQRDLAELLGEGGEQLLGHPRGAHQPAAAWAVVDLDAGGVHVEILTRVRPGGQGFGYRSEIVSPVVTAMASFSIHSGPCSQTTLPWSNSRGSGPTSNKTGSARPSLPASHTPRWPLASVATMSRPDSPSTSMPSTL